MAKYVSVIEEPAEENSFDSAGDKATNTEAKGPESVQTKPEEIINKQCQEKENKVTKGTAKSASALSRKRGSSEQLTKDIPKRNSMEKLSKLGEKLKLQSKLSQEKLSTEKPQVAPKPVLQPQNSSKICRIVSAPITLAQKDAIPASPTMPVSPTVCEISSFLKHC